MIQQVTWGMGDTSGKRVSWKNGSQVTKSPMSSLYQAEPHLKHKDQGWYLRSIEGLRHVNIV